MNATFVALLLGEERGRRLGALVREALAPLAGELRLARGEGLHATLLYLGPGPPDRDEALAAALVPRLAALPAPRLWVRGSGGFPRAREARVLWLGVEEEAGAAGRLAALHEAVLAAAEEASRGAPAPRRIDTAEERGRPYRPHVTVARPRRRPLTLPEPFAALAVDEPWRPDAVHLVESVPGEGAPRYVARRRFPLAAEA